ncbi:MAG: tetratricopeptide repeat protein [Candidatus Omnitrophota bacterium]
MRRIIAFLAPVLLICLLGPAGVQAEEKVKVEPLTHYILAGIYERLDKLEEALREYKTAVRQDPRNPQLHLSLAAALIKQNKLKESIPELKQAIKLASAGEASQSESISIEAHTILALVYSLQGKMDEANLEYEEVLRGALAVDPQNVRIHKSLGQLYLRQEKLSDAQKTYEFIVDLAPSDPEARFYLGTIYEERGERPKAIEEFKAALKLNPEYPDALNSLGYLYAEESINLEEAEQLIKKALEYESNNGAYIDSLGWVYFNQGRYQEAVRELERAVQFFPDSLIYEHLGDAYLKQGNSAKARESWQKSLELGSKENQRVKEKLEKYN